MTDDDSSISPTGGRDQSPLHDLVLPWRDAGPEEFPRLRNMSAGHLYDAVVRATVPQPAEYVVLPELTRRPSVELRVAAAEWNMLWEAAQFRRRFFDSEDLPPVMDKIADLGDLNVVFVPHTRSRYYEYAPLAHLLPRSTLKRFGLPLLRGGQWPFLADYADIDAVLPQDFGQRLARAWASTVWRHIDSGSGLHAFTRNEPLQLLAHNLDFWVPAVTTVIQDRLRAFPVVEKRSLPAAVTLQDGTVLDGAVPGHPRAGGQVWFGEDDARDAVAETVEAADRTGQLRAIIDAIRSNRVVDDFCDNRWSFAKADLERKLHSRRNRVGVRFVELTDTIPVQGPESDIVGNMVTNEFLALLDVRNRQIVILLSSGVTSRTEIAERLGYANHSAVSKRLAHIRRAAAAFFDHQ